jgi:hypothetical protein
MKLGIGALVAKCALATIALALLCAGLYSLFGKPRTKEGKQRKYLRLIKTFCARKMNQCRYGVVSTLGCCWGNERYSGLWLSENGRKSRQTTAAFREV